jgi:hypothetical protein
MNPIKTLARMVHDHPTLAVELQQAATTDADAKRLLVELFKVDPSTPTFTERPLEVLSADRILETKWPDPVWTIPNMLPVGLCILAGAPKIGKSWLALMIAKAKAAGGVALGEHVEQGPAFYLALEDPPRRLQERMIKQGWPHGLPAEFLTLGDFEQQVKDLTNGGGERLARQIESVGYHLVVIDTLSRSVKGDQNDVSEMTKGLTPLHEIAHQKNCTVLLVDHHRKVSGLEADPISDILGSIAKGAMADTIWGLYHETGKAGAKLAIMGREVGERKLTLTMDWFTGLWHVEGDADALEMTVRRQEIIGALKTLGRAKLKDIAELIKQDRSNTYRRLQDMVNATLVRVDEGYYFLPE